ncbi:GAF domain-containing sensor histidine kinase [Pseudonocardia sp. KRD291]|uniref:sensor histidine kinase n=1 Tax=Pseudonocardia sp. KRD291 TaxID=2792007 RepID=UPI001C49DF1F|nr:GAF domain-containing sensor histidine kinase [Pseudonocardia sp. KRD291]MBW0106869.1 GAF domain-containing protein [Pseudonocardia sp. KRD291]
MPTGAKPFDLEHADSVALLDRQTEVLELIAAGTGLPDVLTGITLALEELVPGGRCSVLLLDPERSTLHHGAAPSLPAAYSAEIDGMRIGEFAGSCGSAAFLGRPIVVEDIAADRRWDGYRGFAVPHGLRSCWSSPIRGRGGVLGTFAVYHCAPHRPTPREERLVERLTHLASVAIDHAGLFGALAESEERFRRAFEDNATGMALTLPDGTARKVNRALRELLDRDEDDLLGVALDGFLVPVGTCADRSQYEARARRPDGTELELAVAVSTVRGADGEPVQLSVNVLDVTQRRAAQRERLARHEAEVARSAAEAASRAKSEFVSALGHELRTPLQAITGFTELLGTLDLPAARRVAALEHITGATSHILALVDDVLDVARIEAGALPVQACDLALDDVVGDVLDLLGPLAASREVTLLRDGPPVRVRADGRRLRQVLINLVGNGVRYNHAGGRVQVRCGPGTGAAETAEIAVHDSGRGIPEELMERIFTPFDRLDVTDEADPGVGLGLPLARGLVETMGGTLRLCSVVGAGTTVVVTLPRAAPAGPGPARPPGHDTRRDHASSQY